MESFGLWYKLLNENNERGNENVSTGEQARTSDEQAETKTPKFSLHINFWSLEDIIHSKKGKGKGPYLDVGIEIKNYKLLEYISFYCPFDFEKEDVEDLASKFTNKMNANLIFNANCELQTKDSYTIVVNEEQPNSKLMVFPLDQVFSESEWLVKLKNTEKKRIVIEFSKFNKYLEKIKKHEEVDNLYIRFRIKTKNLEKALYFDIEPLNKSFDSAFTGTRVIDFKINEARNIDEKVRAISLVKDEKIAKFESVHFLVMEPASYDLVSLSSNESGCRELENEVWNDYLGMPSDTNVGQVLAYHWKKKKKIVINAKGREEEVLVTDFSNLVKIKYSKANKSSIFAYSVIVIALGIISNSILNIILDLGEHNLVKVMQTFGFSMIPVIILIVIGYIVGKKDKI